MHQYKAGRIQLKATKAKTWRRGAKRQLKLGMFGQLVTKVQGGLFSYKGKKALGRNVAESRLMIKKRILTGEEAKTKKKGRTSGGGEG